VAGCTTTNDQRLLRSELNQQIQRTNDKIADVERGSVAITSEVASLRKDIEKTNDKTSDEFKSLRSVQAETRAEMTEIREQMQQIRGAIDGMRKDLAPIDIRTSRLEEEYFLKIGKKKETAEPVVEKSEKLQVAVSKDTTGKVKTDKETLYAAAYELFREAKYEKSREGFENFLKQYPKTEFSDNAQFWIGECYYFEKKYEKAIIEYEKVTKNFPNSDKIPSALLKQGLSFQNLGDKVSAKIILQRVVKDFPNTSQAKTARAKLLEIK
jgi:tol-pal system protein YbgF